MPLVGNSFSETTSALSRQADSIDTIPGKYVLSIFGRLREKRFYSWQYPCNTARQRLLSTHMYYSPEICDRQRRRRPNILWEWICQEYAQGAWEVLQIRENWQDMWCRPAINFTDGKFHQVSTCVIYNLERNARPISFFYTVIYIKLVNSPLHLDQACRCQWIYIHSVFCMHLLHRVYTLLVE